MGARFTGSRSLGEASIAVQKAAKPEKRADLLWKEGQGGELKYVRFGETLAVLTNDGFTLQISCKEIASTGTT
jgi:hypothetical protein